MNETLAIFINIGIPLLLIALGLFVGSYLEKKHYQSIRAREQKTLKLPVLNTDKYDVEQPIQKSYLVTGSVVVSIDYFKRILAALRNIFGGRVAAYESLVDRARREAILRMKARCPAADLIINLRLETSTIAKQSQNGQRSVGSVEVIAYGTAIHYAK